MGYAEVAELNLSSRRLIELTDNEDAPGVLDEDLLALLLTESQSIVDGILGPAFTVPFADGDVPPLVRTCTAWIWTYRIYRHREVMEIPQSVKDDYDMALQMLKDMVAGVLDTGGDEDEDSGGSSSQVPTVVSSSPRGWTDRSRTST